MEEEQKRVGLAGTLKIVAAVAAIVIAATGGYFVGFNAAVQQQAAIPNPDVLNIQTFYEPTSLDPSVVFALIEQAMIMNTYETLIWYEKGTATITSWLAESWDVSTDGLTYTFTLQQGIRFHDGTEVDAAAVKFSLDRVILMNAGANSFLLGPIKGANAYLTGDTFGATNQPAVDAYLAAGGVQVVSTYVVRISLDDANAAFLRALASPVASIVSPTAVNANGGVVPGFRDTWMDANIVGTGPFKLNLFVPNERVVLERYDDYWRGPATLRLVITEVVPELASREFALLAGEADMIFLPTTNAFDVIDEDAWLLNGQLVPTREGIVAESGPVLFTQQFMMNQNLPPFDNPHFREGIAYVFPYEGLIQSIVSGFGTRYAGPIPKGMFAYDEDTFMYEYDPAQAKTHFEHAAFTGEIDVWWNTGNEYKRRAALLIKDEIEKLDIGITVNIVAVTFSQLGQSIRDGIVQTFFENFGSVTGDPDEYVKFYGHSDLGFYAQGVGYNDPALEAKILEAATEPDLVKRAQLYHDIQQQMVSDGLYVWIYQEVGFTVMRDWVQGFYWSPIFGSIWTIGSFYYYDLSKG